jgi:multicomponent Na+:H+ antiporter subunit E
VVHRDLTDKAAIRGALRIWVPIWLTFVWILLWGNISAANILSGLAVALVITYLLPLPPVPVEGRVHPIALARWRSW